MWEVVAFAIPISGQQAQADAAALPLDHQFRRAANHFDSLPGRVDDARMSGKLEQDFVRHVVHLPAVGVIVDCERGGTVLWQQVSGADHALGEPLLGS